jgi:hypothetical protein
MNARSTSPSRPTALLGAGGVSGTVTQGAPAPNGTPVRLDLLAGAKACVDLSPVGARVIMRRAGVPGNDKTLDMTPDPGGFSAVMPNADDGTLGEYHIEVLFNDQSRRLVPAKRRRPLVPDLLRPGHAAVLQQLRDPAGPRRLAAPGPVAAGRPAGPRRRSSRRLLRSGACSASTSPAPTRPTSSSTLTSPADRHPGLPPSSACSTAAGSASRTASSTPRPSSPTTRPSGKTPSATAAPPASTTATASGASTTSLLTDAVANDQVQLQFTLQTDEFLELAGWNIDEFCVVGTDESPLPVGRLRRRRPRRGRAVRQRQQQQRRPPRRLPHQLSARPLRRPRRRPRRALRRRQPLPRRRLRRQLPARGPDQHHRGPHRRAASAATTAAAAAAAAPALDGDLTDRGCACDQRGGSPLGHAALAGLLLLGLRRRRR